MQDTEFQNKIDFLMKHALSRCGSIDEAEDLVQETLLAELVFRKNGGVIENENNWLLTILNRRYYDMLRRKYKLATVTLGEYIRGRKKKLPLPLKSVPEQKQTYPYEPGPMVLVYEAIRRGIHKRDLGYPCPEMVVVADKESGQ